METTYLQVKTHHGYVAAYNGKDYFLLDHTGPGIDEGDILASFKRVLPQRFPSTLRDGLKNAWEARMRANKEA